MYVCVYNHIYIYICISLSLYIYIYTHINIYIYNHILHTYILVGVELARSLLCSRGRDGSGQRAVVFIDSKLPGNMRDGPQGRNRQGV